MTGEVVAAGQMRRGRGRDEMCGASAASIFILLYRFGGTGTVWGTVLS